jgi:hypothetical protein
MSRGMDGACSGVINIMYVVGHEHVGVQRTSFIVQRFAQPMQIGFVVFFSKEAGFAVLSPLHDVRGDSIEVNPGAARHNHTVAQEIEAGLVGATCAVPFRGAAGNWIPEH